MVVVLDNGHGKETKGFILALGNSLRYERHLRHEG